MNEAISGQLSALSQRPCGPRMNVARYGDDEGCSGGLRPPSSIGDRRYNSCPSESLPIFAGGAYLAFDVCVPAVTGIKGHVGATYGWSYGVRPLLRRGARRARRLRRFDVGAVAES